MAAVQITLPDQLAQEAQSAGLLAPEQIERMLREHLRAQALARLAAAREALATAPMEPMTPAEIDAEIAAYRSEQRRASGS